ncbi:hypothetical protein KXV92_007528 [Aspergillus fumigatus]|nr:hypothetical protein KXW88_003574 [Aspergillus fumigatus]KAH2362237.1 hypothetical protein KXV98_005700 [Aspergillus fumigatus]KAH3182116.1 hypothetical protein KXV92_007528 [Aspergillus fumigatus]
MAAIDGRQRLTLMERVNRLIDDAFNLSLLHMCEVYILVEHENRVHTFKSSEQSSWPPPDHRLEELYSHIVRLTMRGMARTRLSEDEYETFIQLCQYFLHLSKALRDAEERRVPGENIQAGEDQVGENSGRQDTGFCTTEDPSGDCGEDRRVE